MMNTYTARWLYGDKVVNLATSRGWKNEEIRRHIEALANEDVDEQTITHPFNYLTEQEVEDWEKNGP